ncbi:hypothetical protein Dimus_009532 [Dionaea muscipula]
MGKDPKSRCKVASHQHLEDKAKLRVEDLLSMFTDLQVARKEGRTADVAVFEEQLNQILREWNAELNEPCPASSLHEDSLASLSSELARILSSCEVEDDAISPLVEAAPFKQGHEIHEFRAGPAAFEEEHQLNNPQQADEFQGFHLSNACMSMYPDGTVNNLAALDLENMFSSWETTAQYLFIGEPKNEVFIDPSNVEHGGGDAATDISFYPSNHQSSPSAFLGQKCALWDCLRPALGPEWSNDYCSTFHAHLAMQDSPPGLAPILRPGGIGVKDGLLFTALKAKTQGKDVGIPECGGAAMAKSPWKAPELFDLSILEGETIREWLFFDKPRRAFDAGNRKQRSLPDYSGRGWHESRKQVMKESGGLKRSYYMDPQPENNFDWHLFEYELDNWDGCALYRLEYKLADTKKKSPKAAKVPTDSLADLQKQMGRLTADFPTDNKSSVKGKGKKGGNMR